MNYEISMEGIDGVLKNLRACPELVEKASISFANKMGAQALTLAVRTITGVYNIRTSDVKDKVRLVRAVRGNSKRQARLFSTIKADYGIFPLFKFGATPKAPVSQKGIPAPYKKRRRASVKVLKSGKRTKFEHAFIAMMSTGHIGMFERIGGRRRARTGNTRIRELYSVSASTMFRTRAVSAIDDLMQAKGKQVFQHEMDYFLGRIKPAKGGG